MRIGYGEVGLWAKWFEGAYIERISYWRENVIDGLIHDFVCIVNIC